MGKGMKILIGLLAAVILAAAGIAVWQWDNINALRQGATMDPAELQEQLDQEEQHFKDVMEEYGLSQEELPPEVLEKLISGELKPQEAAEQLLQKDGGEAAPAEAVPGNTAASGQDAEQTAGGGTSGQAASQPGQSGTSGQAASQPGQSGTSGQASSQSGQSTGDPVLNQIQKDLTTMYVLQATFERKLDGIVQEAIAEYSAGAADSGRKKEIVFGKLNDLSALEQECDSQVAAIVSDLRAQLKAAGQDQSLADQVAQAYENEKNMKKAQYIQQFSQ